jgi:SAM-dependent methyltransferase
VEPNKAAEIAAGERALAEEDVHEFSKPFRSGVHWWGKWTTIVGAFDRLGVEPGSSVLDVGCGNGWTTLFLAESGYVPTGIDISPGRLEIAARRASRWGHEVELQAADMEDFSLGRTFDAALVFDALHHSNRQPAVVANVARHLRPGGWALFGEPSLLHSVSPHARRTNRELGWVERGVRVSRLKRDCRAAGLGPFRRFFEGTRPYEGRVVPFGWELVRLVAANLWVAPQAAVWLAAQRPDGG